jgi:hypothetical protein
MVSYLQIYFLFTTIYKIQNSVGETTSLIPLCNFTFQHRGQDTYVMLLGLTIVPEL